MKRIFFLLLISFCTIGGEESKCVVTIESTTQVKAVEEEITFEEGVLEFSQFNHLSFQEDFLADRFQKLLVQLLNRSLYQHL